MEYKNCIAEIKTLKPEEINHLMQESVSLKAEEPEEAPEPTDTDKAKRKSVKREWPEIGTLLEAEYYGTTYKAEVIKANKRLKSDKQIKILNGAATGEVCDSFSQAMEKATHEQRKEQNLKRKGISNGWDFWVASRH